MQKISLDKPFYMEGSQAVSLQGNFERTVDNFELFLKICIDRMENRCPLCGGNIQGQRHVCKPLAPPRN